jgi:hypothetical protein
LFASLSRFSNFQNQADRLMKFFEETIGFLVLHLLWIPFLLSNYFYPDILSQALLDWHAWSIILKYFLHVHHQRILPGILPPHHQNLLHCEILYYFKFFLCLCQLSCPVVSVMKSLVYATIYVFINYVIFNLYFSSYAVVELSSF